VTPRSLLAISKTPTELTLQQPVDITKLLFLVQADGVFGQLAANSLGRAGPGGKGTTLVRPGRARSSADGRRATRLRVVGPV
jgi:hypothetical protein